MSHIIVQQYEKASKMEAGANSYKGLRIHARPGLHEFIGELATAHFKPGGKVLDLAAGTGAMAKRLLDAGFMMCATDYVAANFRLHDSVPFTTADLNERFSQSYGEPFDAIVATEIVEHLENPRHFARECFALLRPGGVLLATTPNIDSPASIAHLIRGGAFAWFSDLDYKVQGHITPLTQSQASKVFNEAGFQTLWRGSFGFPHTKLEGSPRMRWLAATIAALSTVPRELHGECYVVVLVRPADSSTPRP